MQRATRTVLISCLVLFSGVAQAIPFTISDISWETSGFALGSTVSVTPSLTTPHSFDLNVAQPSYTFDFLDVRLAGLGGAGGTIAATLTFSSPTVVSTNGSLKGFGVLLGIGAAGLVVLQNPAPISFGDGGLFEVNFKGFSDFCFLCKELNGTVSATVSLLKTPATSVPEPTTLALLGAGLLGLAYTRRRLSRRRS